ncbi:cytochrome c oxidase polypeptide IV [Pisolithus orientalis]|uniref:cytochrome c oxidase polypeptide IV n=1 Tax=Pisolithus orientalis TaxID=936130 RepID=UPI002224DBD2|nr:cytochrome c oxidase polypeptide IV [Pisolithus orientalis]KAI6025855.1 cytochrome c oxidase polypeptide IV [Pisolithus orientalis]
MLNASLRAVRPVALRVTRSAQLSAVRALSTTSAVRSDHPPPPAIFGPGAKPGELATDEQQATGLERLQLLAEMQGVDAFDKAPLDSSRVGTLEDPIKVFSLDTERLVGCTGSPADSHDIHWFQLRKDKNRRCPECGSVYALDHQGHSDVHHH